MKKTFVIIGIDDHPTPWFHPDILRIIQEGSVFSGGIRHHEIVKPLLPQGNTWINITVPLDNVFSQYQLFERVIVFASGDPLFFGFANTVKRKLPEAEIKLYPSFNSLQLLAHRLVLPYDDMHVVSLTGRPWHEFDQALIKNEVKIGVLTDREHTPATIADRMLTYGYTNYTMHIGENLGNPATERVRTMTIQEAAKAESQYPNNLILVRNNSRKSYFGIPEDAFTHLNGRSKMITKAPIRLLTLSALELSEKTSFWDIGFCTGSVSIEAKLQFPHLYITSFEIRTEGAQLMEANTRKFGTPGITTVIENFIQADLSLYKAPDAVFIGGHGGKLKEILCHLKKVLQPNGIVVFNSVSEESKNLFIEGIEVSDLELLTTTRVSIDEHNPIEIMKARLK
ncbi:precorrin-6y C5,15-methyltransferase (decarboxylating) subunit CbiE [Bacteroides sp. 51]|uniref:precorrin-6y C5,15-methyltransferase (decarboxylating) subunit CbiE n=1 Tax=Bacteroides sp. 51 TaxID=2302938 RepID=UPI0013D69164|nr:precorrin-6y C5,15-methyltransferase (decarboxylating) subunit CbiE [Bacteroides sp. 51]NDV82002.1 precorrin-6y C5,15-methyltransferase (decarboxylating) subunit CbiE [Bacteroides sp. 51]